MKAILIALLVIGVASAVPLKNPRYNTKNSQILLKQQNLNTLLQHIQQKQNSFQTKTTSNQTKHKLLAQSLALKELNLPRVGFSDIQSLLADVNVEQFLGSLNIQSLLTNLNIEQFFESSNIQQFFEQQTQTLTEIMYSAFEHPIEEAIILSFLTSLDINFNEVVAQLTVGTFNLQQYLNFAVKAFDWLFQHPTEATNLANYLNPYIPIDEIIDSIIYPASTVLANVFENFITNLSQNLEQLDGSANIESLLSNLNNQQFFELETVSYILYWAFHYPDEAAIIVSFLTSLGINYYEVVDQLNAGTFNLQQYFSVAANAFHWVFQHPTESSDIFNFLNSFMNFGEIIDSISYTTSAVFANIIENVLLNLSTNLSQNLEQIFGSLTIQSDFDNLEQLLGSYNIQQFFDAQTVTEMIFLAFHLPDEAAMIDSFLTSLDINYYEVFDQLNAGTFYLPQYLNVAVNAFDWVDQHPIEVTHLTGFLNNFMPFDEIIESIIYTASTISAYLIENLSTNVITNISQNIDQIFGSLIIQSLNVNPNLEQLYEFFNIQQYFELQKITEFMFVAFHHPAIIISFLSSSDINFYDVFDQLNAGTFNLYQLLNVAVNAFHWCVQHETECSDLFGFLNSNTKFGEFVFSIFAIGNAYFAHVLGNLITELVRNLYYQNTELVESLNIELLIPNLNIQQFLQFLESFNMQSPLDDSTLEQLLGSLIIIPFLSPKIIKYLNMYPYGSVVRNFFSYFGINLSQIGYPQQYLNPEVSIQAFQFAVQQPSDFAYVAHFLVFHLTIDQIIDSLYNTSNNILPSILLNLLTYLFPSLIPFFE